MLFMTVATSEYSEAKVLESLLARIAKGDKEALGELYERTRAAVFGFAMSMALPMRKTFCTTHILPFTHPPKATLPRESRWHGS